MTPGLSRRRFLLSGLGAAGVVVAAGVGGLALVETGTLPGRSALQPYLGQCGPAGHIPGAAAGPIRSGRFRSRFMPHPVGFAFALPPGARPAGQPVALFLHGYGEDHTAAFTTYGLQHFLSAANLHFAVASVDGGRDSYWHRRADGRDPPAMIAAELLPRLGQAGLDPSRLALFGLSMGGFGALLLGDGRGYRLPAPYTPRAVAASSPAIWASPGATAPGAFDSASDWRAHDLLAPGALAGVPTRVWCGTGDPFAAANRLLQSRLPAGAVTFQAGCHQPAAWLRWFPAQLAFLADALLAENPGK